MRNVQIDFAFKRQDIRTVLTRHRSGWESAFLHSIPSIVHASPSGRIDYWFSHLEDHLIIELQMLMKESLRIYEVRPREDNRRVVLISDVLPFARLC